MEAHRPSEDFPHLEALPPAIALLLQQGINVHFSDPETAEQRFLAAQALDPEALEPYRCLAKHYNRQRKFTEAARVTKDWLTVAARQGELPEDWRNWQPARDRLQDSSYRNALMALKAFSFIHLRQGDTATSAQALEVLQAMDPEDGIGASVVAALLPDAAAA